MAKHFISEPMSTAMLSDPAVVLNYTTGQTSEWRFGGKPYSTVVCLAPYLGGERVQVLVPGSVQGLTEEMAREGLLRLSFVRVKFTGLVLEIKGGEYNNVSYQGVADRATLVQPGTKPVQK